MYKLKIIYRLWVKWSFPSGNAEALQQAWLFCELGTCSFICQDTSTRGDNERTFSVFESSYHLSLPF